MPPNAGDCEDHNEKEQKTMQASNYRARFLPEEFLLQFERRKPPEPEPPEQPQIPIVDNVPRLDLAFQKYKQ